MPLAVNLSLNPPPAWWDLDPDLRPGLEVEILLPANGVYPLETGLLLIDETELPRALVRLREFKTSGDGTVARGHVLRVYDPRQSASLRDLLSTPPRSSTTH